MEPKTKGKNWLIGLASIIVIAASIGFIIWWTNRSTQTSKDAASTETEVDNPRDNSSSDNTDTKEADVSEKLTDKEVAVYLTYWEQSTGFETIKAHHDLITMVNPFWYTLSATGELIRFENAEDSTIVEYCQTRNIKVLPVISNEQDTKLVQAIIHDSTLRQAHIQSIVNTVVANKYDGIEIDYENLVASDRANYSKFLSDLAVALHAENKLLATAVHAKTTDQGTWGGPAAQDWSAIGNAVDSVKIMTYDFHWSTSEAGEIAPLTWMEDVYDYAVKVISPEKILIGIHLYGYDWLGTQGTDLNYTEVMGLTVLYNPDIKTSSSQEKYFTYVSNGKTHTVYYSDASVVAPRVAYSVEYSTGGVAFWSLGGEDPTTWVTVVSSLAGE